MNDARPPYQRPRIAREVDPNRMNWLWKIVADLAGMKPAEVVEACAAAGIAIPRNRVKAWSYAEQAADFSSMNVTELERTLQAVAAYRASQARTASAAPPQGSASTPPTASR